MDETERLRLKAEKKARKAARRPEAAPPAPPPPQVRSGPHPIIWCERTGVERCHRGHWCAACRTYTQTEAPMTEWDEDFPDPRPEIACRKCGGPALMNSRGIDVEMRRTDTGETFTSFRELPIGACWESRGWRRDGESYNWVGADGRLTSRPGPDGRVLTVRLPDGHDWVIDSRANNCTLPKDDQHWCWVREGRPEDGTLDVGKGGKTCSAGAGSIATSRYHGFLRSGQLVSC